MNSTWGAQIAEASQDDSRRDQLAVIPLALVASVEYQPDWVYIEGYLTLSRN